MLATPGFNLSWQVTGADVAKSGDLGYTIGTYEETTAGPKGIQTTDKGKYVVIWKKQADGTWKVVLDVPNSDLPVTR
jgi:ketosteroid isomerase-like protein